VPRNAFTPVGEQSFAGCIPDPDQRSFPLKSWARHKRQTPYSLALISIHICWPELSFALCYSSKRDSIGCSMHNERTVKIWQASAHVHRYQARPSLRGKISNTSTALMGLGLRRGTLPHCGWAPSLTWSVALLCPARRSWVRRVRRSNPPHVIPSLFTYVRKLSQVVNKAEKRNNTGLFIRFILGTRL
jgi:hypothetical protein